MTKKNSKGNLGTENQRTWKDVRSKCKMLGVFEINQEHEFYNLTCMMKEGLRSVLRTSADEKPRNELTVESFKAAETEIHKDFKMVTFAGPVFAHLRHSLGINKEEYQISLSSEECYLQFISNSKSKANLFLSNDKRFFLKTQNKREVQFLLHNLKAYVDHLEKYPHSLIVRFLGVHRIHKSNQSKYFIVMQSVFYPDERISTRYDIKGCEVGRWTDPSTKGTQATVVLKDNNFEGKYVTLDRQCSWLVDQVNIDSAFLCGLNVLDYSILLAHQPLHQDELDAKHTFANLTLRIVKSMDEESLTNEDTQTLQLPGEESAPLVSDSRDCGQDRAQASWENSTGPLLLQEITCTPKANTDQELVEFQAHHCRLLPDSKNAVHVIDGPAQRYFVGIVDIFTEYGWKKKLENLWKRLRYPGRAYSTVTPNAYSQRFCQWVHNHTQRETSS